MIDLKNYDVEQIGDFFVQPFNWTVSIYDNGNEIIVRGSNELDKLIEVLMACKKAVREEQEEA